jgi:hypothetical protein
MALLVNTIALSSLVGRRLGGEPVLPMSGVLRSGKLCFFAGEHAPNQRSGVPNGHLHPSSWSMPVKTGGMSANLRGSGGASGSAILVLQVLANLLGQGGLSAQGGLIVNMLATLSGAGGISGADLKAFLGLVATIGGSGGVLAGLTGLAALQAQMQGQGQIAATATGVGQLGATIRGYGDLTPEGLRDAVWSAVAAQYDGADTMGAKLNAAGSGGVDLNALAAAVWAYASRSLSGAQADQLRELFEIHGLDPAKPLQVTDAARTAGAISQAVASSAPPSGASVSVTRLP